MTLCGAKTYTMTEPEGILVGPNILLRVRDAASVHHPECVEALRRLDKAGTALYLGAQVLIEYWVVATRPLELNGLGLTPEEVLQDYADLGSTFVILPEPADVLARWQHLVTRYSVRGRQAHDARLVALMLSHGVTRVLTLNTADFIRYGEIVCLAPANV